MNIPYFPFFELSAQFQRALNYDQGIILSQDMPNLEIFEKSFKICNHLYNMLRNEPSTQGISLTQDIHIFPIFKPPSPLCPCADPIGPRILKLSQKLLSNILHWNLKGFLDTSIVKKMTVSSKPLKKPQNSQF